MLEERFFVAIGVQYGITRGGGAGAEAEADYYHPTNYSPILNREPEPEPKPEPEPEPEPKPEHEPRAQLPNPLLAASHPDRVINWIFCI